MFFIAIFRTFAKVSISNKVFDAFCLISEHFAFVTSAKYISHRSVERFISIPEYLIHPCANFWNKLFYFINFENILITRHYLY